MSLVDGLAKSGAEIKAIAWHYRHGHYIMIKGVTFPVYYWYAPADYRDEFRVQDFPGPLRPTDDSFTSFSINGSKDEKDVGSPQQLVQTQIHKSEKAGYRDLSKFQLNIRTQSLECMQQHYDEHSGSTIYC